jgi:hypothetical protein
MIDEHDDVQSIPDAAEPVLSPTPSEAPPGATEKLHWTNETAEADYTAHFAKAEDIGDYAEFRKDIDDFESGVEFSDDRRRDFQHKIKQATAEAAAAADGLEPPADRGPEFVSREEAQQAIEQATNFARAQQRFESYFDPNRRDLIGQTESV